MPCRDYQGSDSYEPASRPTPRSDPADREKIAFLEAALCATFRALDSMCRDRLINTMTTIDFKKAGVSRKELSAWWKKHKAKDAKDRLAKKRTALAKLTSEEINLLGLEGVEEGEEE